MRAEDPYANFLVGERSLGLAGAFVALADDPSAVYHNPGGIGALETSALAGSIWALSLRSRTVDDGFGVGETTSELSHFDISSFPLFVSAAIKLGTPQADGVRPHGIAVAVVNPRQRELQCAVDVENGPPDTAYPSVSHLHIQQQDRARWFGATYAHRIDPRFSLDASAFFAWRSFENEETEINATQAPLTELDDSDSAAHVISSLTDISAYHAVFRIGGLYNLSSHWRFGAMFQPPGLVLHADGDVDGLLTEVSAGQSRFERRDATGLRANLPIPWELRFGASWIDAPFSLLTLDMALRGAVGGDSHH